MSKTDKNYGESITDKIIQVNDLLGKARQNGIQMKQLAEVINISPSVLSAFYRTVIPAFLDNITKMKEAEGLEYSFSLANNISKNRFIPFLPNIILALEQIIEDGIGKEDHDTGFYDNFINTLNNSQISIQNIEGTYITYSISSGEMSMKCEPMSILRAKSGMIKVSRLNVHGIAEEGFGMIADHQSLTIMLNEAKYPKYYPLTMQINIPLCFNPKIYRGLYMTLDSSSHPIARRVIIEKVNDSGKPSALQGLKAETIQANAITQELQEYFNYLCEKGDKLRVSVVPEPTADIRDLRLEKKILKLYDEL